MVEERATMKTHTMPSRISLLAALALLCTSAAAQDYPRKPIRWVTPYPPGGSTTFVSRLIGDKLAESFGRPVIIDNRPGGNTIIGVDAVAKATPDGYTVLLAGNSQLILALLMKPPYDIFKDLAPVSIIAKTNYILVATPSLPASNLQEFIAYAKTKPGQLNVGSVATGSGQHLMGELFNMLAGVKLHHVPYKGGSQIITDLMGGHVHVSFSNANNAIPHVRSGKLKGLAITGDKRAPAVPDLPTYAEAGLPGYDPKNWQGMMAPAGTPTPIVAKLSGEIGRILEIAEVRERVAGSGMEPFYTGPEKMAAQMKADYAESAKVIKTANIHIEP
jgi:tripartite-type tricarboxylate transporter receptor subunit TctC